MPLPDDANIARAQALHRLGDLPGARRCFEAALAENSGQPSILRELGVVLMESGAVKEALARLAEALDLDPNSRATLLAIASAQIKAGNVAGAGEAIALAAEHPPPNRYSAWFQQAGKPVQETVKELTQLGNSLYASNRLAEAAEAYEAALAASPDDATNIAHLAGVFLGENRLALAIEGYERALAIRPGDPWIRYCLGIAYLTAADFRRGWECFEARLDRKPLWRELSKRRWQGTPSCPPGKSMLLVAEQGQGDVIHFIRFVPGVVALGFRVSVLASPALKPLLAAQPWLEAVYDEKDRSPDFDEYCPLLSLPRLLADHAAAAPAPVPYLRVPADRREPARLRLAGLPGPKIGLVWAGNPKHEKDRIRSLSLKRLIPLLPKEGASLFSLQKQCPAADRGTLARLTQLHDLSDQLGDFAATAAFVSQLDLLISVDTSVAHLAGALGVPLWILLPFAPDWRWQLDRSDSPWYPTARLYRQPALNDWDTLLGRVAQDLAAFVRHHPDSGPAGP